MWVKTQSLNDSLLAGELESGSGTPGTLATRIQMAAMGIPAFFTPAGYGTEIAAGKEVRVFNNKHHLMEYALHANYAIVKAWKGDRFGNLVFRKTTRIFQPLWRKPAILRLPKLKNWLSPAIWIRIPFMSPGIYVHRIFQGTAYEKRIEKKTIRIGK